MSWAAWDPELQPLLPRPLFSSLLCPAPASCAVTEPLLRPAGEGRGQASCEGHWDCCGGPRTEVVSGLVRVFWGPQGVVGGTLMPLCLNEGRV